jgi:hypothetical protein
MGILDFVPLSMIGVGVVVTILAHCYRFRQEDVHDRAIRRDGISIGSDPATQTKRY